MSESASTQRSSTLPSAESKRSRTDLIGEIFHYARVVVQLQDAKREAGRDVNRVALGVGLVVGGIVFLSIAALFALGGGVAAVHHYAHWAWLWSILSVAGASLVTGGVVLAMGLRRIRKPFLLQTRAALRRRVLEE